MSAEILEVDAQYDVGRQQSKLENSPNAYANVAGCDRSALAGGRRWPDSRSGTVDATRGGTINDEAAPHDERAPHLAVIGCGLPKLLEICTASSIHTAVWIALLWWIDLFNASRIFGGHGIVDTVFAFVFIWISTFVCFYALVEEDD
ncbi:MAG: hypothetical protein ACR2PI_22395 [Hyphomicrobiaceae bacterium]